MTKKVRGRGREGQVGQDVGACEGGGGEGRQTGKVKKGER